MKKIWDYLMAMAESFGKARAATVMARMGKYEDARRIMSNERC